MAGHRYDISHNDPEKPVAIHFNLANHSNKDVNVTVIRHSQQWTNAQRKQTEHAVIEIFQTVAPFGMNLIS
jgi:hypothetical protein